LFLAQMQVAPQKKLEALSLQVAPPVLLLVLAPLLA
jgi:hypothetical protein